MRSSPAGADQRTLPAWPPKGPATGATGGEGGEGCGGGPVEVRRAESPWRRSRGGRRWGRRKAVHRWFVVVVVAPKNLRDHGTNFLVVRT